VTAPKKPVWPWVLGAVLVAGLAAAVGLYRYLFVPYEPGPWHQIWTVTVTNGSRSETSTGFGVGRCGDEAPTGVPGEEGEATSAKKGARMRACFAVGLCPGDAVCDCAAQAKVEARCEAGQTEGRTRLGDMIKVPIH